MSDKQSPLQAAIDDLDSALTRVIAENATLRAALQTQAEEAAKLIAQRDELLAALHAAEELHRVGLFGSAPGQIDMVNKLRKVAITNATT